MKKYILLVIATTLLLSSYAQKQTVVSYFKKDTITVNKDDYDYKRIIEETDTPSIYRLFEFYPDNKAKTSASISKFDPYIVYEGLCLSYNKQGVLVSKINFKNGKLSGECIYYYDNGKLQNLFVYDELANNPDKQQRKWVTGIDSLGNQFIKDGNGTYKGTDKEGLTEEGNYLDGYKNGIWKGTSDKGSYEEIYENGIFKSGRSTLKNGKQIKYREIDQKPEFKKGIAEFYQYLNWNYKLPQEAEENGVRGRLYITFVVEKDGSLTNYEFKNNLGYGTQEEAERVLNSCPKWIPGMQHGIPVRVKYTININLPTR
ncbi:energy transducer TonB [Pedobacter soli]|uniref:TonB protein C-terminal n=1 Tax=Pedobacter soli TaxID=390242 RepID=A0A1G6YU31_9SPHI|nr:energy transducer TonB [Pedobacter soli]SDD93919.1 TonB protein C-terminal [Pedobacter soli]